MILKSVKAQNFLSFGSLDLSLENRGLLLLNGENLDNPALNNNGAGKSSILEAIVYALYGKTLRGLKGDSIIHREVGKDTKVFLDLIDDDGSTYRIARYRKHSVNKNKSLLYKNGKDITPKSEVDFENYISDLLQADYDTFTASLLYSAESFKFATATDSEIKKAFDTMLGLDVFQKALAVVKERLRENSSELCLSIQSLEMKKESVGKLKEKIKQLEQSKISYDEEERLKRQQVEQSLLILQEKSDLLSQELEELKEIRDLRESQLKKSKDTLQARKDDLKQVDELKLELSKVKGKIETSENSIESYKNSVKRDKKDLEKLSKSEEFLRKKIEGLNSEKDNLKNRIGKPCKLCGQPLTLKSFEPARQEFDTRIAELESEIVSLNKEKDDLKSDISDLDKKISDKENEIAELKKTKDEFEGLLKSCEGLESKRDDAEKVVEKSQNSLNKVESDIRVKNVKIDENKVMIEQLTAQVKSFSTSENPFIALIKDSKVEKENLEKEIDGLKVKISRLENSKKDLQFWEIGFSNQGIKSYILDDITPFLNRRLNKYLTKLTSGQIEAVFSTTSTLKSGEKREKFNLSITNNKGGEQYIANSGGEKKRIDLSINLALQDLIASRSTKKLNIAIFDEVFDSLDENGVDGVVSLLTELSQEKSTILVVSHNEYLKSFFTNVLTVSKKNGFSRLKEE